MKSAWALTFGIAFSMASLCFANQYDDLQTYAKEVPHAEIDQAVVEFIQNETNEDIAGMTSHYTLALFESTASGRSWYILDGYYQLKSGKILFLDFQYDPKTKTSWPIENYQYYLPARAQRFLLEADEICNPYKRHFIGIVRTQVEPAQFSQLQNFFEKNYQRQPLFVIDEDQVFIIDPTKSLRGADQVIFTLREENFASSLEAATGLTASMLTSGRQPSTPEVKKTYVGSTPSCVK
ncbi:hypothetical protein [Bdellovibrio sp. HCB337]|uniref:hypothetical protein n=1 Tax=Bdellovibrio sp. HCB337 TaxID=3394358 RepID=UPI0039A558C5